MRTYPEHEDIGLVDNDETEDLRRTTPVNPVLQTPAEAARTHQPSQGSR